MATSKELFAEADVLDKQVQDIRKLAMERHQEELLAKPLAERMIYAAYERCPCGEGLAYDPAFEDANSPFKGPLSGYWDCSAIILGTENKEIKHTAKLPFSFYEIKSEYQPSANGATTRKPKEVAQ